MKTYYRKTTTIQAEQFDIKKDYDFITFDCSANIWLIDTINGQVGIKPGDFIAFDVAGEPYPIDKGVFERTYSEEPIDRFEKLKEKIKIQLKEAQSKRNTLDWIFAYTQMLKEME